MKKCIAVTHVTAQYHSQPLRATKGAAPADAVPGTIVTTTPQVAISLLAAVTAAAADWLAVRYLGAPPLGFPLFAGIAAASWFATWRSGVATTLLCLLLTRMMLAPHPGIQPGADGDHAAAAAYLALAAVIILLCHLATRARQDRAAALDLVREGDVRAADCVALLAHELRNPLAAVCTGLDLIRHSLDPDALRTTAGMMERQLSHLTHLIDDLLEAARLDRGKARLQLERRSVDSLVAEAIALATAFTAPRRQQVAVELAPDVGSVDVDPGKVAQVLGNLLHNASKFSPPGSTITVRAAAADPQVTITVRDAGIGIAPEQLERIFCRYTQVEPGAHNGLGLGLSLVRQWMELHGGSVVARSAGPGAGSEFILTFRRTANAAHGVAGDPPACQFAPVRVRGPFARTAALVRRPVAVRPPTHATALLLTRPPRSTFSPLPDNAPTPIQVAPSGAPRPPGSAGPASQTPPHHAGA